MLRLLCWNIGSRVTAVAYKRRGAASASNRSFVAEATCHQIAEPFAMISSELSGQKKRMIELRDQWRQHIWNSRPVKYGPPPLLSICDPNRELYVRLYLEWFVSRQRICGTENMFQSPVLMTMREN